MNRAVMARSSYPRRIRWPGDRRRPRGLPAGAGGGTMGGGPSTPGPGGLRADRTVLRRAVDERPRDDGHLEHRRDLRPLADLRRVARDERRRRRRGASPQRDLARLRGHHRLAAAARRHRGAVRRAHHARPRPHGQRRDRRQLPRPVRARRAGDDGGHRPADLPAALLRAGVARRRGARGAAPRGGRLPAGSGRDPRAHRRAHPPHRPEQPEQPDRGAHRRAAAAGDRRGGPGARRLALLRRGLPHARARAGLDGAVGRRPVREGRQQRQHEQELLARRAAHRMGRRTARR